MKRKYMAMRLGIVAAAIAAFAMLAPLAQADTPKPGYTQFAGCPSPKEDPKVEFCIRSTVKGGHFQMGSKDVPITNPITVSGGAYPDGSLHATSKGGMTVVKQKVPGGVVGLTGLTWLLELFGSEALTLYAATELAGQPNIGETLSLPIKVHLINPVLGNNCYVGSVSNPIKLNMTTGTTSPPPPNKPITGTFPEEFHVDALGIIHANKAKYVDNSFAAPGASGCTLTLFGFIPISINGLVNSQSGLPSAAGKNETIQNIDAELVQPSLAY